MILYIFLVFFSHHQRLPIQLVGEQWQDPAGLSCPLTPLWENLVLIARLTCYNPTPFSITSSDVESIINIAEKWCWGQELGIVWANYWLLLLAFRLVFPADSFGIPVIVIFIIIVTINIIIVIIMGTLKIISIQIVDEVQNYGFQLLHSQFSGRLFQDSFVPRQTSAWIWPQWFCLIAFSWVSTSIE